MTPQIDKESPLRSEGVKAASDFHIALVFDSALSGARALKLAQRQIEQFNRDFLFHLAACGYGVFTGSAVSTILAQADRANMVLVVVETPLPEQFWLWLKCWAAQSRYAPALVAAIMKESAEEASRRFRAICEMRNIDFICQVDSDMTRSANPGARAEEIAHEKLEPQVSAFARGVVEKWSAIPSQCGAIGEGPARCRRLR